MQWHRWSLTRKTGLLISGLGGLNGLSGQCGLSCLVGLSGLCGLCSECCLVLIPLNLSKGFMLLLDNMVWDHADGVIHCGRKDWWCSCGLRLWRLHSRCGHLLFKSCGHLSLSSRWWRLSRCSGCRWWQACIDSLQACFQLLLA